MIHKFNNSSIMAEEVAKKKVFIRWTSEMKYKLAFYASKYEAYIKTDEKMADKWKKVLNALVKDSVFDETFKSNPPEADTLATTFKRNKADVMKELGISEEGANLSGLEGEPTPYQNLMINMEEEIQKFASKKMADTEKEKKKKAAIFTHEEDLLKTQMKRQLSDSDNDSDLETANARTPNERDNPSVISNVTTKHSASNSKGIKRPAGFGASFVSSLIDLTKEDPLIVEEEIRDREQKRKIELERHELEMEKYRKQMDVEEKRLELEERRLRLEEAKHQLLLDAMNNREK
jgi:hypothetical protein